jgi:hypothetical protein
LNVENLPAILTGLLGVVLGGGLRAFPLVRKLSRAADIITGIPEEGKPPLAVVLESMRHDLDGLKVQTAQRASVQDDQAAALLTLSASVEQIRQRLDSQPPDVPRQRNAS